MQVGRKRPLLTVLLIMVMLFSLATPVFAAYEQDQYIKLTRSLNPNQTTVEAGTEQDIIYQLSGDEFSLDPAQVDTQYLLQKNIALVLDVSGSMGNFLGGGKTSLTVLKESANKFLDHFEGTNTKISIVPYSENANNLTTLRSMNSTDPITGDVTYLRTFINALVANGNTNIGDGMRRAYWQLKNTPQNSVNYIIVMTDGEPNIYTRGAGTQFKLDDGNATITGNDLTTALNYAKNIGNLIKTANMTSYFIGLTPVFSSSLEQIAVSAAAAETSLNRHYYQVTNSLQVDNVYNNILINEIGSTLPMNVTFNETFPAGVEIVSLPAGFTQSVLGDGRVQVTGQIANIALQKNNATGKYSITPWNETIRVKYRTAGAKDFDGVQITYTDPFGNNKTAQNMNGVTVQVNDTEAPSVPVLSLVQAGGESVDLAWTASTDNAGVAGYHVYRDGTMIGTTTDTSYTASGLTQNTNYSFTVSAFDAVGNESGQSNVVTVLTPDISPPTVPANVQVTSKTSTSVTLSWSDSTDNVGVKGYNVYRDGVFVTQVTSPGYTDTSLVKGKSYEYTITAIDNAGNESAPSGAIVVNANTAPTADAGPDIVVEATSPAGATVTLDGSGSTDADLDPLTYTWTGDFGTVSGMKPSVQLSIGSHTVTLTVSDGDLSSSETVQVQVVDTTPPTITGSKSPDPNANGWYNADVTVHFSANDSASGIQSVTPDTVVSTEGANQSVTGTAVDVAGNSASATVGGINIDKTGPVIVDSTLTSSQYKTTDTITVGYEATDALSGLASVQAKLNGTVVSNGQTIDLKSKVGSNVLEITATDKAGNVTVRSIPFTVDINVTVDIKPETLNPKSNGGDNSITVKIDFPSGFGGSSIDTVKLWFNGSSIDAVPSNNGGKLSFTVKFDRQSLIALLGNQTGTVQLTIKGNAGGAGFVGSDTINVLDK
ncbi:VWA domain-containing protein [Cohnella pontilimi]|uniref:VWA domain-containing protein n=1 Tax=Cohnella pontilimi TaxID=2564100 RepID=A0A4U0F7Y4_9BACL|nr:vWA domain-containing protein [Cohnella pontilimi]TJY40813.1 VWA domain-containing protein [Cohnella pontilimi]